MRPASPNAAVACLIGAVVTVACAACDSCGRPPPAPADARNLILISVDTLRADRLNCYGYGERRVSPRIDALAADGILFESFITSSPWTTPAHMTMLTSLSPSAHGLTATFGKLKHGLTKSHEFFRLEDERVTLAETLLGAGFATGAFTGGGTVAGRLGFDQGFERYDESMFKLESDNTEAMFEWIDDNLHRSFFLFWHTFEVHAPYLDTRFVTAVVPGPRGESLAEELEDAWDDDVAAADALGKAVSRQRRKQRLTMSKYELFNADVCEALYTGSIGSMDAWLGRLVGFLRDRGIYDQTTIVFTSDHGEEFGERYPENIYDRHGHLLYDEIVRVPLIVKLPGQAHRGKRVRAVTRMVDLMPTLLDVVGVPAASDEPQGTSLRPLWEGGAPPTNPPAFTEALTMSYEQKSMRTDDYKYVIEISAQSVRKNGRSHIPLRVESRELYDMQFDPGETANLLAGEVDQTSASRAQKYDRALREHAAAQSGRVERIELDAETLAKLEELGYLGDEGPDGGGAEPADAGP